MEIGTSLHIMKNTEFDHFIGELPEQDADPTIDDLTKRRDHATVRWSTLASEYRQGGLFVMVLLTACAVVAYVVGLASLTIGWYHETEDDRTENYPGFGPFVLGFGGVGFLAVTALFMMTKAKHDTNDYGCPQRGRRVVELLANATQPCMLVKLDSILSVDQMIDMGFILEEYKDALHTIIDQYKQLTTEDSVWNGTFNGLHAPYLTEERNALENKFVALQEQYTILHADFTRFLPDIPHHAA
jgi:hypothetical protein